MDSQHFLLVVCFTPQIHRRSTHPETRMEENTALPASKRPHSTDDDDELEYQPRLPRQGSSPDIGEPPGSVSVCESQINVSVACSSMSAGQQHQRDHNGPTSATDEKRETTSHSCKCWIPRLRNAIFKKFPPRDRLHNLNRGCLSRGRPLLLESLLDLSRWVNLKWG